ncbi:MAG: PIG-L deacetylase family protein [Alphaproteobacteria bacterium]|tara:strand:+ start:35 stop:676 length:642 start_codon:yes stop_codon:yes gene_type:complete
MSRSILFVAPHLDDESLGCGGTIIKFKKNANKTHWLIITSSTDSQENIKKVNNFYDFNSYYNANFLPSSLDQIGLSQIINKIKNYIIKIKPEVIFLPFSGDAHSDHRIVFACFQTFLKSFRYDFIKKVYVYETLSETNYNYSLEKNIFQPNTFVNISNEFKKKCKIIQIYKNEFKSHPFPRSLESIKSLATIRGAQGGFHYAEGFYLIKNIID